MARLVWDEVGEHLYETGTRRGVLYPKTTTGTYGTGVAWNGLTGVSENPSGAEETALYADDQKYLSLFSAEEFGFAVKAYTYPDEWAICDGSAEVADGVMVAQQVRRGFGLCYRTVLGNDQQGENYGYKLHIIYNATASPSSREYATINDSPDAIEFSWDCKTTPINFDENKKPTALVVIDSTKADPTNLAVLEAILYGSETTQPRLPSVTEIIQTMGGSEETTGEEETTEEG